MSTQLRVTIKTSTKPILEQQADTVAIFLEHGFDIKNLESAQSLFPGIKELFAKQQFTAKPASSVVIPATRNGKAVDLIFMGLGKRKNGIIDLEMYRKAIGTMARIIEARRGTWLAVQLPDAAAFGIDAQQLAKQTTIIMQMALYHFDEFITDADRKIKDFKEVDFVVSAANEKATHEGIQEGNIIAQSVNQARFWIDMPPDRLTPDDVMHMAKEIAKEQGLKYTSFNEKEVVSMGMGGLAAVSKGSDRDCHLVIMEYAGKKDAPTIALVGKGITFDSGGLSIKPASNMETMKEDMSGAAAVINTMLAIAKLKPDINVIGITPLSENLPSGKAIKPGDIAVFYNGKTAEIKNTDAEGRLILGDALSYAVKHYKLDAILDIATLTGACAYALGPHFTGMMSQHDDFARKVEHAARVTGDKVWRLPLPDEYKPAIKSTVADICNIGSPKYMAGAVTAALFLQNFVGDVPWVHLDIAGSAFDVPDISYYRADGATGAGVRLMIELVMRYKTL